MTNTLNKIIHNGDEYELPRQKALVITLTSAGWTNNEQTVTATGVTASNSVIISPVPTYISDYTDAKIYCSAQGTDSLTFTCDSTPASDIEVNVLVLSAEAGNTPTPPTPPTPASRPTITGFTYDSKTFSVPQSTYGDVNCITWKPDGTKFYIAGETNNTVYQFSCSTAWDITTGTYDSKHVATNLNVSVSLRFSDDGLTLWIAGGWNTGYVYKWTLSTAWDVSTASYVGDATGKSNESFYCGDGYCMADSGNYLYVLSREDNRIRRYTMSTPYDITTLQTGAGDYQEYTPTSTYNHRVILNPQGTQLFYYARADKKIHICALSTPFDLTTISETSQYTVTTPNTVDITSVAIDDDGNKMYIGGYGLNNIYQYSTTTA